MLLTVKPTTIMVRLRLHGTRDLLGPLSRRSALCRGPGLEHCGVLDEGLGYAIARVVRSTIVLVLRVRVVVGNGRRITLLRALAARWLRLCATLRR